MHAAPRVILETDMTFDVDDVGALATLHALVDRGEAELIAVDFNETHEDGGTAIHAINSWYGRGDIPIGIFKGDLPQPDESKHLNYLAKNNTASSTAPIQDARLIYPEILAEVPDQSVVIISIGFLNSLNYMLRDHPSLVEDKVVKLVVMGGRTNDSFNVIRHELVGNEHLRDRTLANSVGNFGFWCGGANRDHVG